MKYSGASSIISDLDDKETSIKFLERLEFGFFFNILRFLDISLNVKKNYKTVAHDIKVLRILYICNT